MTPVPGTTGILQTELAYIRQAVDSIADRLESMQAQQSAFRENYERRHAELDAKANAAQHHIESHEKADIVRWAEVDQLKAEVRLLAQQVAEIRHSNRIQAWFYNIIGGAFILWLVGRFLGLL